MTAPDPSWPDPSWPDPSWIDLASRAVGGGVVAASDDTFAEKENLVAAAAPTHAPHTFGHRGQIYDGWETRRRRDDRGPDGDDWAVVRLGIPGLVRAVVVDTAFFDGNHPESARVETRWLAGRPTPAEAADPDGWEPLCATDLRGDTAQEVVADVPRAATHVRLTIHPDGGVARLRVLGEALPDARRWRGLGIDLAALAHGGRVLDASDRHYSPPENLLLPGSAAHMGQGWETRRRRDAGHDWVDVALGVAGRVRQVVVDTTHFLGNAPGSVRLLDGTGAELLPETPVRPDTEQWLCADDGLDPERVVDRVRVEVRPDGGFARLRLLGSPTADAVAAAGVRRFDHVPAAVAEQELLACCTSSAWAATVAAGRPYGTLEALLAAAADAAHALGDADLAAALAGHARIGDRAEGAGRAEQAGVRDDDREALAAGNRAYEARFGHVYLVRAAGRSGAELLALLHERLGHDPATEAGVVREQLAEITVRRLADRWAP